MWPLSCTGVHLHSAPQHAVLTRMCRAGEQGSKPARLARTIQDLVSEVRRILIPRTRVNRGVLVRLPPLGDGIGAQPHGDVLGLHGSARHPHEVVA